MTCPALKQYNTKALGKKFYVIPAYAGTQALLLLTSSSRMRGSRPYFFFKILLHFFLLEFFT